MNGNDTPPSRNADESIIAAIEGLSTHTSEQTVSIRLLASAIKLESEARDRKVKQLQRNVTAGVIGIIILIFGAGVNIYNTTRNAQISKTTQQTNAILVGCLTPGQPCADASAKQTQAVLNQIRQTQFVIALCQRQNPVTEDPEGTKLVKCVQGYYPDFDIPAKVK